MITTLVQSAFQTGYLSVESEGLIRQILALKSYNSKDLEVLKMLYAAIEEGHIRREAHENLKMPALR